MIEIEGASFAYGRTQVLAPISVSIGRGERVFVVGPNGAGKSTLLRLIAGLAPPASGRISVAGIDPHATPRAVVAMQLAFLPQNYELTFPFTVAEVVLLGRYAHGRSGLAGFYTRAADREEAARAMAQCDVADLAERRWNQLSGGEQRRALLAQAFCQDADLLLLDEPTASLDPAHAIDIFEALAARGSDKTALIVTHDLNLAARFADRLLILHRGALVADGAAAEVLPGSAARAAFGVELHLGQLPGTGTTFVVPA